MATVAHIQSNFNGRWNVATWFAGDFAGRKTVAYSSLSPRSFMDEPRSLIEGAHSNKQRYRKKEFLSEGTSLELAATFHQEKNCLEIMLHFWGERGGGGLQSPMKWYEKVQKKIWTGYVSKFIFICSFFIAVI